MKKFRNFVARIADGIAKSVIGGEFTVEVVNNNGGTDKTPFHECLFIPVDGGPATSQWRDAQHDAAKSPECFEVVTEGSESYTRAKDGIFTMTKSGDIIPKAKA